MKRKNSIVIKKVKNNNFLFKNSKILRLYKKFKSVIFKDIKNKNFALAVSGGADSLCLACFGKIYSSELDNKYHVLIVDHNLRKESHQESLKVKEILKKKILKVQFFVGKEKFLRKIYRKMLEILGIHSYPVTV